MKTIKKGTIKKSALLTCTFALAGVLAAPAALAESTSEQIDREYKKAMQAFNDSIVKVEASEEAEADPLSGASEESPPPLD